MEKGKEYFQRIPCMSLEAIKRDWRQEAHPTVKNLAQCFKNEFWVSLRWVLCFGVPSKRRAWSTPREGDKQGIPQDPRFRLKKRAGRFVWGDIYLFIWLSYWATITRLYGFLTLILVILCSFPSWHHSSLEPWWCRMRGLARVVLLPNPYMRFHFSLGLALFTLSLKC